MTELSYFAQTVLEQKYAQVKEDGSRETWDDVAQRVAENILGPVFPELVNEAARLIRERKFIPGGRYLYAAGRPFQSISNCFGGTTEVLTSQGSMPISETVNRTVEVQDGSGQWVAVEGRSYGKQPLQRLTLSRNGRTKVIEATPNHRWSINGQIVTTENLRPGMRLDSATYLGYHGALSADGMRAGIVYGDGSMSGRISSRANLCGAKITDLGHLFEDMHSSTQGNGTVTVGRLPAAYKELPPLDSEKEYLAGWLAGYIATDGCVSTHGVVMLNSSRRSDLEHVEAVAAILGIRTYGITHQIRKGYGSVATALYRIVFDAANLRAEFFLRSQHRDRFLRRQARGFRTAPRWSVVSVRDTGKVEEVYCFRVPTTGRFVLADDVLTLNCYTLLAEDSREGWAKLMYDATHCLMSGGGIGVNYSSIRPNGARVGGLGGICTGPIALMEAVNETARQIQAGGSRRSAVYASLHWWHPDVFDFIALKDWDEHAVAAKARDFNSRAPMDMTNISVALDDEFFAIMDGKISSHAVKIGREEYTVDRDHAEKVYASVVKNMLTTGEPGLQIDVGENAGEIGRNACVSYDTTVLTPTGYRAIGSLVGEATTVWNGRRWTTVTPRVTGTDRDVWRVELSDGRHIDVTDNHEWVILNGYVSKGAKPERRRTEHLGIGDAIAPYELPTIDRSDMQHVPESEAYTQGFISAEGMDNYPWFDVYGSKLVCIPQMALRDIRRESLMHDKVGVYPAFDKRPKSFVPMDWDLPSTLAWLAGVLDGDATWVNPGGIQLASVDRDFLSGVQSLLSTLGVNVKITAAHAGGDRVLPDGKGGKRVYMTKPLYRLHITCGGHARLREMGMVTARISSNIHNTRDAVRLVRVSAITYLGNHPEVYCFTDPIDHQGLFNGVATGQCTELTTRDHLDVCNLGPLNMARFDDNYSDWINAIEIGTALLIAGTIVGDVPNKEVAEVRERTRRLGLGLMGIYDWLVARGYRYEPNDELAKWLADYERVSRDAANRYADRLGVSRPVKVRAIAPTGTTAIIGETTSGIEPLFATAYKRRYLQGSKWHYQYVVDAGAKRLVEEHGVNPLDLETAYDLAYEPMRRIDFQAWVQQFVDHGISSTLNLPSVQEHALDPNEFGAQLYKRLPKLRGLTAYPNGARQGQPLTAVPYLEAANSEGVEFEEVGAESACKSGVCGI